MKLSFIIPVYNVKDYLSACLNSVLKQEGDYEIVLVNDGSTDGSDRICADYAETHSRVRLFSQANSGLSAARNLGIKEAKGDYLVFLDSDDMLASDAILSLENSMTDFPDMILMRFIKLYPDGTQELYSVDYNKVGKKADSAADFFKKLNREKHFYLQPTTCVVRREFLLQNELFFQNGIFHEDELWFPQIFMKAESFVASNDTLFYYRLSREGSITSRKNIQKAFDRIFVEDALLKMLSVEKRNSARRFLRDRIASLQWGLVCSIREYREDARGGELKKEVEARLKYLRYGGIKYRFAEFLYRIGLIGR